MSEKYPTWLTGHVKEWAQKRLPTVTLCSTTGNELLEVWYYGDLLTLNAAGGLVLRRVVHGEGRAPTLYRRR